MSIFNDNIETVYNTNKKWGKFMKKVIVFFFFSFYVFISNAMDRDSTATLKKQIAQYSVIQSQKKFKIFDPEKMVDAGVKWNESIPKNLIITPDEKGVLIGEPGQIRYVSFGTLFYAEPVVLIEHPCVKHSPMFAVAQKEKALLVVSAGNYLDLNRRVSEYIIFQNKLSDFHDNKSHNVFRQKLFEVKKLNWPIQAIALNPTGKVLAIASHDCVHVIELATGVTRQNRFQSRIGNILVVDVAVKPGDIQVAVVNSKGVIDIKKMSGEGEDIEFCSLKSVETADNVKEIHFFDSSDLLFVTGDKAKIIKKSSWLENSQGTVKSRIFSCDDTYGSVSIDQSLQYATVHWTNNTNVSKNTRSKIKVRRENGTSIDEFVLKMTDLPDFYNYITSMGQDGSGVMHLLSVALRGKRVVALTADGHMRLWTLPDTFEVSYGEDKVKGSTSLGDIYKDKLVRRRSHSSPIVGEQSKKGDESLLDNRSKRKSAQRPFRIFRTSTNIDKKKKEEEHGSLQSPPYSPRKGRDEEALSTVQSIDDVQEESKDKPETQHSAKDLLKKK